MARFLTKSVVLSCVALSAGAAFSTSAMAESVLVARPTQLLAERYLDAQPLASLEAGERADIVKVDAGWVQILSSKGRGWVRAMYLKGQGAGRAQVATLEGGRSNKLHRVSTTGIRSISRASRHALIIGVGEYAAEGVPSLKGVKHDVDSASQMARAMGVPDANITYLRDKNATAEEIRQALTNLNKMTYPGDRVFVYYSGHGTRWIDASYDANACTEGLLASDAQALTNREISRLLAPISKKADKLVVFYDACHSGGIANQPLRTRSFSTHAGVLVPKFVGQVSPELCAKPANMKTRSLSGELGRVGAVPENTVFIAASRPDEVSFDDANSGGLATVAWRDCLLGKATDLDGSGAISVSETTACAQLALNARLANQPDILGQKMVIGGNGQFIPAFLSDVAPEPSPEQIVTAAAADAERIARERAQAQTRARLKAEAEALEAERLAAEQLKSQRAEQDRLLAQAERLKDEKRLVDIEAEKQKIAQQQEQARLEAQEQAQTARIAQERAQAQALAKLKAESEAQERQQQVRKLEQDRVAAEQREAEKAAQERLRLEAEQSRVLAQQQRAKDEARLAQIEADKQNIAQQPVQGERVAQTAQVTQQISLVETSLNAMEPSVPVVEVKPIKPAGVLNQMFQQRDGARKLEVTASRNVLRIGKDPLELTVKSPVDGYLYVALAGSDEESFYLLFPNRIDANNYLKAGEQVKLPRRSWRITAGGPPGQDRVLVMVTDAPRDLSQLRGDDAGPFVMPLLSREGKSQLQALMNQSGNADQKVCQEGGKTRNLQVQAACSDAYAAALLVFDEVK